MTEAEKAKDKIEKILGEIKDIALGVKAYNSLSGIENAEKLVCSAKQKLKLAKELELAREEYYVVAYGRNVSEE